MHFISFEVLTAVVMKWFIFCDIISYSPLKFNQIFGGTCCLHLQDMFLWNVGWLSTENTSLYQEDRILYAASPLQIRTSGWYLGKYRSSFWISYGTHECTLSENAEFLLFWSRSYMEQPQHFKGSMRPPLCFCIFEYDHLRLLMIAAISFSSIISVATYFSLGSTVALFPDTEKKLCC
jgi:hypothetical protein